MRLGLPKQHVAASVDEAGAKKDDDALRQQVNAVLARWRTDGTRDRILARWLPYWQRLESAERSR